ncbi:DUF5047 domain-containing protein [Kutzneria chonburiensis]|uniref:DUF5047 domain-containing protein n=1 Tax=Kutzneria chonburiensis TaxID=1483604 RepID=A0ABV6N2X7_9PSEU|nr:DUF5047 domain-containing protein [Kutzneria chonburiensis]
MWPLTALAAQTLTSSHQIAVRGTAYTAALGVLTDLPISGGSVTVASTSQVRRTASVDIADPALWPANPLDILSPLGSELAIEYGVVLPGVGIEWVPLIRGVINSASRTRPVASGQGAVTLVLNDRSSRVADDRLDSPAQTIANATAVSEITRLIQLTLPSVTVTDRTGSSQVAVTLDIARDKWADGVEKLADSIGAEVFADPLGNFVIRNQPQLTDPSVWTVATGRGGVLVQKDETLTRDLVYNRVVASGATTDGTAPVWVGVSDLDPNSPTMYGGPFGRKPRFYTSPLLTTTAQCQTTAAALLARTKGIQATVTLATITNPGLDAGDVLLVRDGITVEAHIIDQVTIPLRHTDMQQITTRVMTLPAES